MENLNKLGSFKKYYILTVLTELIQSILFFAITYAISYTIDNIENMDLVLKYGSIVLISMLLYVVIIFLVSYTFRCLYLQISKRSIQNTMNHLINKNYEFFNNNDNGTLLNHTIQIVSNVNQFHYVWKLRLVLYLISFITVSVIIFYYSYIIGIILIVLILILGLSSTIISAKLGDKHSKYIEATSIVNKDFLEITDNISLIKNLNKESYFLDKQSKSYEDNLIKRGKEYSIIESLYNSLVTALTFVLPFITLIVGVILSSNNLITLGCVISIYSISGQLQEPIRNGFSLIGEYKTYKANIKKIKYIFEMNQSKTKLEISEFNNITINSKYFKYDKLSILNDFKLEVNHKDFIVIKGASGSGKSTLFKLLTNKITSDTVDIKLNNKSIKDYSFNNYIKEVSQTNYILNDTIRENICIGNNYELSFINKIISLCCLDDFINKYGIDKVIDNTSSNISGGELQRISLARILITKPKVLLLDEVSASLDLDTSSKLSKNIKEYCNKYNITCICISHKDEFDQYATKIVNMV